MESALRLRAVLHSEAQPSDIFLHYPHSVQDAYSLRCVPQVHGIVHDTVQFVKRIISRELNAATDNPMVFAEDDSVVSAGNFHGEYPAKVCELTCFVVFPVPVYTLQVERNLIRMSGLG